MIGDSLKELKELKRELAKLLRHLAYFDEHSSSYLTPDQYMHQLPTLITSYRKQADSYRRWFIVTQVIVILLSASVTSLSGGWIDKYISIPWTIPVFSALISILTSFTLFFKLREKGTNLQQTADAMDLEHKACNLSIGPYKQGLTVFEPLLRKENATGVGKRAPCAQVSRWTANQISDQEKAHICSVKKDALSTKLVELQQKKQG